MPWFKRTDKGILTPTEAKREVPDGLWFKSPAGKIVHTRELKNNCYVVPEEDFHVRIGSAEYFEILFDNNEFTELDPNMESGDPLRFTDTKPYPKRIKESQLKSDLKDAVRTAYGKMNSLDLVIACMDFEFIGGSLGSVMGEKISRACDYCMEHKVPFMIINKSGGAVSLGSLVFVNDSLAIGSATAINGSQTLTVTRKLITAAGAGLAMGGLVVTGDSLQVSTPANYTVGTTTLTAAGAQLIPVLPYTDLILSGSSTHKLTGRTTASGQVTVTGSSADLVLGGRTLSAGSLIVNSGGRLTLTQPLDSLQVAGGMDLDMADETGKLTAGVIEASGNLLERGNTSPLDFAVSGTRTVLSGGAATATMTRSAAPYAIWADIAGGARRTGLDVQAPSYSHTSSRGRSSASLPPTTTTASLPPRMS